MRRISRGFTIIELLIVIAVIGILATISLVGFNRYQQDTRDAQRSSKATILSEAFEKYYDKNGEYPACPAITAVASTVTTTTLPGVEQNTLLTPTDTSGTNSIKCQDLAVGGSDIFAYVGDGSSICSTGSSCLAFTIKYKEESTNTIKSITSRRTTNLLTSGDITDLSATTFSFSQVNLLWGAIGGANSYNIQWKINSNDFTSPTGQTTSSTASASVTGLTLGTLYYFRVQPANATAIGNWSNKASATTFTLDTPVVTAIPDPAAPTTQIKVTWPSITNATSYTVDYNSTGAVDGAGRLTSPTTVTVTSPCGNPCTTTVNGLSIGTTKYFKVIANAAGYTSGWSTTQSATTIVPAPTCLAATVNSTISITASWAACPVSVATSYKVEYSTSGSFSPLYSVTVTSTSTPIGGLWDGQPWFFRVYALVGAIPSTASPTANATTPSVVLSGAVDCGATYSARPNYNISFQYVETSYDITANTSNVYWLAYRYPNKNISSPNGTYDETLPAGWSFNASLNGSSVVSGGQSRSGRWRQRGVTTSDTEAFYGTNTTANSSYSGTVTIAHDADGTKTIGTYVYNGSTGIFGTASCSSSYVLSDLR